MKLESLVNNAIKGVKSNSPQILAGLGIAGVITTGYLAAKAAHKATKILEAESPDLTLKEKAKKVWLIYIPPVASGAVTIGCILGSSKANSNRTAAAITAYSLSEKAFTEYREKVIEQISANKDQKIRDAIAQDHVSATPMPEGMAQKSAELVVLGKGHVRCFEMYTGRYFLSDMEALRRAENEINAKIMRENYVTLDEFYDLVDLKHTSYSGNIGWNFDRILTLRFSTVLAEDGEPCLAFEYSHLTPL